MSPIMAGFSTELDINVLIYNKKDAVNIFLNVQNVPKSVEGIVQNKNTKVYFRNLGKHYGNYNHVAIFCVCQKATRSTSSS